jgi:Holliday junction resolvase-like predicted endonuclease
VYVIEIDIVTIALKQEVAVVEVKKQSKANKIKREKLKKKQSSKKG